MAPGKACEDRIDARGRFKLRAGLFGRRGGGFAQRARESFIYPRALCSREPSLDDLLREWWCILPSTAVMRRSIFDRCGGFAEESGPCDYGGSDVLMRNNRRETTRPSASFPSNSSAIRYPISQAISPSGCQTSLEGRTMADKTAALGRWSKERKFLFAWSAASMAAEREALLAITVQNRPRC